MVALLKMPSNFKIDPAERRVFERKEIQARVQGKRLDHSIPARQQPHVSLALRDLSLGGLSAISTQPLEAGERVAVFFPPPGHQPRLGRLRPNPPLRPQPLRLPRRRRVRPRAHGRLSLVQQTKYSEQG